MSKRIHVILLYGGKSGEHEISLISAASVLANLDASKYKITPVGMDKEGCFYVNDYVELLDYKESLPVKTGKSQPLSSLICDGHLAIAADVVFPIVHGPLYEDGCLQGLLSLADAAFVGCDTLSSALGMDKDISRRLTKAVGVPSARYRLIQSQLSQVDQGAVCRKLIDELGTPLFVKPCSLGSSVGIHKVWSIQELLDAVKDASRFDTEVLVEEFIKGREFELAVLENISDPNAPKVSIPGEISISHSDGFYSYQAKYIESNQTQLHIPAKVSESVQRRLQEYASDIFKTLKCKGLARVDFFYCEQTDKIFFNEINTLPGFTTISMYPKLWVAMGMSYKDLLDELIQLGIMNHKSHHQLMTHYQ